jgi:type 1 glutamine amidotransferase
VSTRNALIVRGGWDGHQPVETTDSFIPFLEGQGFTVRVEETTGVLADAEYLATVDLIVHAVTMTTIEPAELAGLRTAVAAGTGLAGWHGGIVDSYRNSADYLQLVGGQFAHHQAKAAPPELKGEAADNFVRYTVDIVPEQADHPIVTGIDGFELETEQYWVLSDAYNDVLATTTIPARDFDGWQRPVTCPAVWTRRWGQGTVFVCTAGHDLSIVDHPAVRTIIERGMTWVAR